MCLLPFFLVLVLSIGASYFAAKKKTDYFLANRSLQWPVLLGTFLGAQIGGGFILGNTEVSFHHGLFGSMYGVGIAIGMLLLGCGFGAKLRTLNVGTLPELLKTKYGSPSFQKIAAVVSILSLGGGLMCQAIGLKMFLASLGFGGHLVYFFAWNSVVLYTTYGGLLAVVWTDTIQALIMISMLAITFISALGPEIPTIIAQTAVMDHGLTGMSLSALLFPLCFIFVQQDMAQRCFAAKTPRDVTVSCLLTAIALIILTGIPTMCGILGNAMGLSPDNGSIFMQVMQKVAHPAVFVMAASAVLLAIISTASAILLALSSNVTHDMTKGRYAGHFCTLITGLVAGFGPYISSDIIGGLVVSYEISVGALFIPIICAVMTKRATLPKETAIGAALFGSLGTLLSQNSQMSFLGLAAPFILSPTGFAIGLLIAKIRRPAIKTQVDAIG
jgi:SSS family solute:Na+ symporter